MLFVYVSILVIIYIINVVFGDLIFELIWFGDEKIFDLIINLIISDKLFRYVNVLCFFSDLLFNLLFIFFVEVGVFIGVYLVLVVEESGNKFVVKLKLEVIEYDWFGWVCIVGFVLLRGLFCLREVCWEDEMLGWELVLFVLMFGLELVREVSLRELWLLGGGVEEYNGGIVCLVLDGFYVVWCVCCGGIILLYFWN